MENYNERITEHTQWLRNECMQDIKEIIYSRPCLKKVLTKYKLLLYNIIQCLLSLVPPDSQTLMRLTDELFTLKQYGVCS